MFLLRIISAFDSSLNIDFWDPYLYPNDETICFWPYETIHSEKELINFLLEKEIKSTAVQEIISCLKDNQNHTEVCSHKQAINDENKAYPEGFVIKKF